MKVSDVQRSLLLITCVADVYIAAGKEPNSLSTDNKCTNVSQYFQLSLSLLDAIETNFIFRSKVHSTQTMGACGSFTRRTNLSSAEKAAQGQDLLEEGEVSPKDGGTVQFDHEPGVSFENEVRFWVSACHTSPCLSHLSKHSVGTALRTGKQA